MPKSSIEARITAKRSKFQLQENSSFGKKSKRRSPFGLFESCRVFWISLFLMRRFRKLVSLEGQGNTHEIYSQERANFSLSDGAKQNSLRSIVFYLFFFIFFYLFASSSSSPEINTFHWSLPSSSWIYRQLEENERFDLLNEIYIQMNQFLVIIWYFDLSTASVSSFYLIGPWFFNSNQCILDSFNKQQKASIFFVFFWCKIILEQYINLQPSILLTFKEFGKNVI